MKSLAVRSGAVAAGGFAGTVARFGLNHGSFFTDFPLGTLIENLLGSLLLGLLIGWLVHRTMPEPLRAGLGVGFCGGFTTMSTLASDLVFLVNSVSPIQAAVYLLGSLVGGVALALLGLWIGGRWGNAVATRNAEESQWKS